MAEYTSMKIRELIDEIKAGRIILPAMQRNFVWSEDKVCNLFDSLMRDYPIGTFLFWEIKKENFQHYTFNNFIDHYDEARSLQRGERSQADFSDYKAVLDGQQRITSLYLGISGYYRLHIKNKKWDNSASFYNKFLCINILEMPDNEDNNKYSFKFKKEDEIENWDVTNNEYWVKVSDICSHSSLSEVIMSLDKHEKRYPDMLNFDKRTKARELIITLFNAYYEKPNINYYLAKKEISETVDMFVRVNSGGVKLDASDLMLSVATGENGEDDMHRKIQSAIDEINAAPKNAEDGFKADKEFVLTAGLLFTDMPSISLKNSDNYKKEIMNEIFDDKKWESIIEALKNASIYIEHLGFCGRKLTSKNLVLPIALYFYRNNLGEKHKTDTSNRACCDRIFIRQWLIRAMMNSVFSDGTGSTLIAMRSLINSSKKEYFPLDELMEKKIKCSLNVGDEQIEDMINLSYGDSRIVPLLCELVQKTANSDEQVDHIWAKALLTSKNKFREHYPNATMDTFESFKEKCNCLSNLQLLDRTKNQIKSDREFGEWLKSEHPDERDRQSYMSTNIIPEMSDYCFSNFLEFTEQREKSIRKKIKAAFPSDFTDLVKKRGLTAKI